MKFQFWRNGEKISPLARLCARACKPCITRIVDFGQFWPIFAQSASIFLSGIIFLWAETLATVCQWYLRQACSFLCTACSCSLCPPIGSIASGDVSCNFSPFSASMFSFWTRPTSTSPLGPSSSECHSMALSTKVKHKMIFKFLTCLLQAVPTWGYSNSSSGWFSSHIVSLASSWRP